mmetsp:Transcript_25675/g.81538  ORF Transcript_25675/g.81538 Transcript_25675/m.81538 type:complete len:275 (-) Transcript_25675:2607-3431(-)
MMSSRENSSSTISSSSATGSTPPSTSAGTSWIMWVLVRALSTPCSISSTAFSANPLWRVAYLSFLALSMTTEGRSEERMSKACTKSLWRAPSRVRKLKGEEPEEPSLAATPVNTLSWASYSSEALSNTPSTQSPPLSRQASLKPPLVSTSGMAALAAGGGAAAPPSPPSRPRADMIWSTKALIPRKVMGPGYCCTANFTSFPSVSPSPGCAMASTSAGNLEMPMRAGTSGSVEGTSARSTLFRYLRARDFIAKGVSGLLVISTSLGTIGCVPRN